MGEVDHAIAVNSKTTAALDDTCILAVRIRRSALAGKFPVLLVKHATVMPIRYRDRVGNGEID